MDVLKFIDLVRDNQCLWNQHDAGYHLRVVQCRAWRRIAKEMDKNVVDLKRKWRGLRDTFGKELRKNFSKKSDQVADEELYSRWPFFQPLIFLRSVMSRRDTKWVVDVNEISDTENSENTDSDSVPSPPPGHCSIHNDEQSPRKILNPAKKAKRRQTDETDSTLSQIQEEKLRYFQENAIDPDAQFLMSLLPFLKDIPKQRKLMVRAKLQQVLIDEQNDTTIDTTQEQSQVSL